MAGIENIVNEILSDARSRADEVLDQARKAADEEMAKASEKEREAASAADARTEQAVANYEDRIRSQCEQESKLAHLAAKQEVIDGVLDKALTRLKAQEPSAYFDMLKKLITRTAREGEGELLLSKADLDRLPADFVSQISSAAGGSLKLSDTPADIDGGFILRYGQIEENCELSALFAENRDRLQDLITRTLW